LQVYSFVIRDLISGFQEIKKDTMNDILRAVADVGFPIVIAVYLLMVFGKKLDRLTDAVEKLSRYVEGLGKNERN
jgi:hypothetical protein